MLRTKGGSGRQQGRKKDWGKKPESRISVPSELAEHAQKQALVRAWTLLGQSGLDFIDLVALLKNSRIELLKTEQSCHSSRNPRFCRMYSTTVAASFGVLSSSDADSGSYEETDLNQFLIKELDRTIILKVTGKSMIDDGIYPGSMLIVEVCDTSSNAWLEVNNGDIVIARINGIDLTVKRFRRNEDGEFLEPRNRRSKEHQPLLIRKNPSYENVGDNDIEVIGIVRSVTRFFK